MKFISILSLCALGVSSGAQTIDFGIDVKVNNNIVPKDLNWNTGQFSGYSNKYPQYDINIYEDGTYWYDEELLMPNSDFSFKDLYGDTVQCIRRGYSINNNFEIPIYIRYTDRNNWFVDLRFSSTKYKVSYHGDIVQSESYYKSAYSMDQFITDYGGQYTNDTVAYMQWFNEVVKTDTWSKAEMRYEEEFKYRSIYLGGGYKFFPNKTIRPWVYTGIGLRSTVNNFRRKHFDLDENYLDYTDIKADISELTNDIPSVRNLSFSYKGGVGIEFYRYHLGLEIEQTFFKKDQIYDTELSILNYTESNNSFTTISFSLGVDLINFDLRKKDFRKKVYDEEFTSLKTSYTRSRLWTVGLRVEAPIVSQSKEMPSFTAFNYTEILDPSSGYSNFSWQSLTFKEITKVNWLPKFSAFGRRSIINRFEGEAEISYTNLEFDNKVLDFRTVLLYDDINYDYDYDIRQTKLNNGTFRTKMNIVGLNTKLYFTPYQNSLIDVRVYAGGGLNFFFYKWDGADKEFGVNGEGEDLYEKMEIFQENGITVGGIYNESFQFSEYSGDIDLDQPTGATLDQIFDYYGDGGTYSIAANEWSRKIKYAYLTVIGGLEVELNRFLLGASFEYSLGSSVEGLLLNNYWNISGTLGYALFAKNKPNNKILKD